MSYFNRNTYFSVILQGVCNHKKLFIDVYAGQPGSVHDNNVFEKSDLYNRIENNILTLAPQIHIIGDLAYKLSTHMLVGFKNNGHLTQRQINFNQTLNRVRIVIEHTFGLLKGRFRRLKLLETKRLDLIPVIIIATCILHNVCIMQSDFLETINLEQEIQLLEGNDNGDVFQEGLNFNPAIRKRNDIVNDLPLVYNHVI